MPAEHNADKKCQRSMEQRGLIQDVLQYTDEHLDADGIYQQARQKSPSISLSTVICAYLRKWAWLRSINLVIAGIMNGLPVTSITTWYAWAAVGFLSSLTRRQVGLSPG